MGTASETVPELRVAPLQELEQRGVVVVSSPRWRIAVFAHQGEVHAVDNRCPHMGFPLDRGSLADGLLTCHWHQARFDLRSGCAFDLWADDVATFATEVRDGVVFVGTDPRRTPDVAYHRGRLRRGMEQDIGLVQAKSLLALLDGGAGLAEIARDAAGYGSRFLGGWSEGMVRLTCVANLYPSLSRETAYQALLYAVRRIASEAAGSVPRRERQPLEAGGHDVAVLKRWLRQWVLTRHRDGAERTVLTGVEGPLSPPALADLVFGAACERPYANTGHLFDFTNKAFELVELLGAPHAAEQLPLLMPQLVGARGAEETTEWHHPIEIVEPLRAAERELPELLEAARGRRWSGGGGLVPTLLGDDPIAAIDALRAALAAGAPPESVARHVAYVAALRLARFATSNEVTDWLSVQHTFHHANAVHQAVRRSPTPDVVRAVFHAAIAVYHDRYLNVPAARLPSERGRESADALPDDGKELRGLLLETLDRRAEVERSARIVARHVRLGHPLDPLIDTLAFATVREDLDFHALQTLDAGVRQCRAWAGGIEVENILVGVVRALAAHCPTRRAGQQTAAIALRLHRGERVYEGDDG